MQVENDTLFGRLYNNFDWMVRFTYCRVPLLRDILRKMMFKKLYSSDIRQLDDAYEKMAALIKKAKCNIKGKTVLELGPGNSYALAFNFLLSGTERTILVDKYPRRFDTDHQKKFLKKEMKFFKDKYGTSLKGIITKDGKVKNEKIESIKASAERMKTVRSRSIDIIVSVSVLEHVKDLKKAFKEMQRVLKPGGLMVHKIDLRDHYNFNRPLLFLKYSKKTWENWLTREGYSYTNRFRADDIEEMARGMGFEVAKIKRNRVGNPIDLKRIHPDFFGKDLDTIDLTIVLTK